MFTFLRTLQCRIEDSFYALAINRIRHYYVEAAPDARRYMMMPIHDTVKDSLSEGVHSSPVSPMLTVAGSVAVVESVLLGITASLTASLVFATSILVSIYPGVAFLGLSLAIHQFYHWWRWRAVHASYDPKFPDPAAVSSSK